MGKVKGSLMAAAVEAIRGCKSTGRRATPQNLRCYLDQRILYSRWYREDDYLDLLRVCAGLLESTATPSDHRPPEGVSVFEFIGILGAQRCFDSVPFKPNSTSPNQALYKAFIREDDPTGTLKNYDTFWELRHDTGWVHVKFEKPEKATVEITDYALVSAEYCQVIQGDLRGCLHYAGAKQIEVVKARCRARGDGMCQWVVTWKDPAVSRRRRAFGREDGRRFLHQSSRNTNSGEWRLEQLGQ